MAMLVVFFLLLAGGITYFSTVPTKQPVKTIEVDVSQSGNAQ
ncbi:MAG: hypothetical protein ABIR63_01820 [Sphingomicrobium sp.]